MRAYTTGGMHVKCALWMHCSAQCSILAKLVEVINDQKCAQVRRHAVKATAVHNPGVALLGGVMILVCYALGPSHLAHASLVYTRMLAVQEMTLTSLVA